MDCTCMYCYEGLCFKQSKMKEGLIATPCDGCKTNKAEIENKTALNIIL